jgi:hypothetical protein
LNDPFSTSVQIRKQVKNTLKEVLSFRIVRITKTGEVTLKVISSSRKISEAVLKEMMALLGGKGGEIEVAVVGQEGRR